MMEETASANTRMEAERSRDQIHVLVWAMLFGWAVGFLMGTSVGVAVWGYFQP